MMTGPDEWKVVQVLDSKKNKVYKVEIQGNYLIVKKFDPKFRDNLKTELTLLKECRNKGLRVPELIDIKDDTLILEYISGTNCKKIFDSRENVDKILSGIAEWLARFHTSFGFDKRKGDCILANFILFDDKIYGIDFEEAQTGDFLRDLGDMCTSVLRMRPAFTDEKFNQVEFFLDIYFSKVSKPRVDITEKLVESLLHYSKYSSQGELMKKWGDKIKEEGLDNIH